MANTKITSANLDTLTTLTVDDITIDGSTISDAGDLTLDVGGDIILDAGGADISFKVAGTEFGSIFNVSDNLYLNAAISDKDIILRGNDGGSFINALTLDMSDAGQAIFNSGIQFGGGLTSPGGSNINIFSGSAINLGTNSSTRLNIDANGSTTFTKTGTNASPHIKLVESGDAREFNIYNDGSGNGHLVLADSDDDTPDTEIVLNDNGIITMLTGNSERMRINANGKVSIGGTEDTYDLMIKRPSAASATSLVLQRVWNQNQAWQAEALTEYFTDLESTAYPRAQIGFYRGDTSDNNSSGFIVKTGLSSSGMATRFKVTATGMVEMPEQPAFMAKLSSGQAITGTNTTIAFNSESFDRKSNHSNGVFTAPHAGVYLFGANFLVYPWTSGILNVGFYKGASLYSTVVQSGPAAQSHTAVSHQCLIECAKDDEITVKVSGSGMNSGANVYGSQAYWWGYMVG